MRIRSFLFLLVGLACLLPRVALADFLCDADYLSAFDERLLEGDCEVIHEVPINGPHGRSTLRLIRYAGPTHGADGWIPMMDELAARVGAALTEMGGIRLQNHVDVFLVPDTLIEAIPGSSLTGPIHGAVDVVSNTTCYVAIYKVLDEVSTEDFVYTIAHEIFHCVQHETWPVATNIESAEWWSEGTAEYFANLALPGTGNSATWVSNFDGDILDQSMVDLAYQNVVFFSWLGQTSGAGAIPGLIGAMPLEGGTDAQLAALATVVPNDQWQMFTEDYLSGRVSLPGGTSVPEPSAVRGYVEFPDARVVEYQANPYQIDRIDLVFKRDHTFQLLNSPAGLLTGARGPEGGYAPLPEAVDTCEAQKRYRLYATTTQTVGQGQLTVEAPDLGPGACCLIGEWTPTETALNGVSYFGTNVAGQTCGYGGGGWELFFWPDGAGQIVYSDFTNFCKSPTAPMRVDNILNGSTSFDWRTTAEGVAQLHFTSHSMSQFLQLTVGEMVQDLSGDYPGPATDDTGMAYTCSGNSLSVVGMFNLFVEQADHTKVVPVP